MKTNLSYVVFTDPQFGLMDMLHEGGEGIDWSKDVDNMEILAAKINSLKPKPSFIFCTGKFDISNVTLAVQFSGSKSEMTSVITPK